MTMTTVEVLRAARKRIEDPAKWWDGSPTCTPEMTCAHNAITCFDKERFTAQRALARVMSAGRADAVWCIFDFNDSHSHAEVLAAFDRAIANEEAREAEFTAGHSPVEIPTAVLA